MKVEFSDAFTELTWSCEHKGILSCENECWHTASGLGNVSLAPESTYFSQEIRGPGNFALMISSVADCRMMSMCCRLDLKEWKRWNLRTCSYHS